MQLGFSHGITQPTKGPEPQPSALELKKSGSVGRASAHAASPVYVCGNENHRAPVTMKLWIRAPAWKYGVSAFMANTQAVTS